MEKTIKYKVWMKVEEMYLDEQGTEQHRDVPHQEEVKLGEFYTLQKATEAMGGLEFLYGVLPEASGKPDPEQFTVRGPHDQLDFDGASYQDAMRRWKKKQTV